MFQDLIMILLTNILLCDPFPSRHPSIVFGRFVSRVLDVPRPRSNEDPVSQEVTAPIQRGAPNSLSKDASSCPGMEGDSDGWEDKLGWEDKDGCNEG